MKNNFPRKNVEFVKITEPCIAFRISRTYREDMSVMELYDSTRNSWKMGARKDSAEYAFAVYKGIVKEVYSIIRWFPQNSTLNTKYISGKDNIQPDPDTKRWEFVGNIAPSEIRKKYLNKDIYSYLSSRTDFDYINC